MTRSLDPSVLALGHGARLLADASSPERLFPYHRIAHNISGAWRDIASAVNKHAVPIRFSHGTHKSTGMVWYEYILCNWNFYSSGQN